MILHCVAQTLPVSHVKGVEEQRIHVGVSAERDFQGVSEVETEKNEESFHHHVDREALTGL